MMKKIVLIGGGGHAACVIDSLRKMGGFTIAGIIDRGGGAHRAVLGVPLIGADPELGKIFRSGVGFCFITVGSIGDASTRARLAAAAGAVGFKFPVIIDPDAVVSRHAFFGDGSYVAPGAVVNARAETGRHCIINTSSVVDHDCQLGDFVHVAPGAVLSGGTRVGRFSHIGSGATVIQGISIGDATVVGAGSVVVKDIGPESVAYGNPCRRVKKNAKSVRNR